MRDGRVASWAAFAMVVLYQRWHRSDPACDLSLCTSGPLKLLGGCIVIRHSCSGLWFITGSPPLRFCTRSTGAWPVAALAATYPRCPLCQPLQAPSAMAAYGRGGHDDLSIDTSIQSPQLRSDGVQLLSVSTLCFGNGVAAPHNGNDSYTQLQFGNSVLILVLAGQSHHGVDERRLSAIWRS